MESPSSIPGCRLHNIDNCCYINSTFSALSALNPLFLPTNGALADDPMDASCSADNCSDCMILACFRTMMVEQRKAHPGTITLPLADRAAKVAFGLPVRQLGDPLAVLSALVTSRLQQVEATPILTREGLLAPPAQCSATPPRFVDRLMPKVESVRTCSACSATISHFHLIDRIVLPPLADGAPVERFDPAQAVNGVLHDKVRVRCASSSCSATMDATPDLDSESLAGPEWNISKRFCGAPQVLIFDAQKTLAAVQFPITFALQGRDTIVQSTEGGEAAEIFYTLRSLILHQPGANSSVSDANEQGHFVTLVSDSMDQWHVRDDAAPPSVCSGGLPDGSKGMVVMAFYERSRPPDISARISLVDPRILAARRASPARASAAARPAPGTGSTVTTHTTNPAPPPVRAVTTVPITLSSPPVGLIREHMPEGYSFQKLCPTIPRKAVENWSRAQAILLRDINMARDRERTEKCDAGTSPLFVETFRRWDDHTRALLANVGSALVPPAEGAQLQVGRIHDGMLIKRLENYAILARGGFFDQAHDEGKRLHLAALDQMFAEERRLAKHRQLNPPPTTHPSRRSAARASTPARVTRGAVANAVAAAASSAISSRDRRAEFLISQNRLSDAASCFVSDSKPADLTTEVIEELQQLHPPREAQLPPLPANAPWVTITADELKKLRPRQIDGGKSAGPCSIRGAHILPLLDNEVCAETLADLCTLVANNQLHESLRTEIVASRLVPLMKPNKSVRPIAVGNILVRLTGKALLAEVGVGVTRTLFRDIQYALRPAGTERIIHLLQERYTEDCANGNGTCILSLDHRNAYNATSRVLVAEKLFASETLSTLWRYFDLLYRHPSALPIFADGEIRHELYSEEGVRQGCSLGPILFCLAVQSAYEKMQAAATRVQGSRTPQAFAFSDDLNLSGSPEQAIAGLEAYLSDLPAGISVNMDKSKMLVPDISSLSDSVRQRAQRLGLSIVTGHIKLLGSFVGKQDDSMMEALDKAFGESSPTFVALDRLRDSSIHMQSKMLILGNCLQFGKIGYILRTLPPRITSEVATRFDAKIRSTFYSICGITEERSAETDALLVMPIRCGGLGIRSAAYSSYACYLASALAAVAATPVSLLDALPDGSTLHNNLRACWQKVCTWMNDDEPLIFRELVTLLKVNEPPASTVGLDRVYQIISSMRAHATKIATAIEELKERSTNARNQSLISLAAMRAAPAEERQAAAPTAATTATPIAAATATMSTAANSEEDRLYSEFIAAPAPHPRVDQTISSEEEHEEEDMEVEDEEDNQETSGSSSSAPSESQPPSSPSSSAPLSHSPPTYDPYAELPLYRMLRNESVLQVRLQFVFCRLLDDARFSLFLRERMVSVRELCRQFMEDSRRDVEDVPTTVAFMRQTTTIVRHICLSEQSAGIALRTIPTSHQLRINNMAMYLHIRLRLGLPPVPGVQICTKKHDFESNFNHEFIIDPAHHLACTKLIHTRNRSTTHHNSVVYRLQDALREYSDLTVTLEPLIEGVLRLEHPLRALPPPNVEPSPGPDVDGEDEEPTSRAAGAETASAFLAHLSLTSREAQANATPDGRHQRKGGVYADLAVWGDRRLNCPAIVDVTVVAPTSSAAAMQWIPKMAPRTRPVDRTVFHFLRKAEARKMTHYNNYLRKTYSEETRTAPPGADLFHHLGCDFVPAAMTIYGNIGPKFDAFLRKMSRFGMEIPGLYPTRSGMSTFVFNSELARLKSLIAVAHVNSMGGTFSFAFLRGERRGRDSSSG